MASVPRWSYYWARVEDRQTLLPGSPPKLLAHQMAKSTFGNFEHLRDFASPGSIQDTQPESRVDAALVPVLKRKGVFMFHLALVY